MGGGRFTGKGGLLGAFLGIAALIQWGSTTVDIQMAKQTIADLFAETLADVGVKHIWGVTGDSLNGLNDSLHRFGRIKWMHVRHEEVAAFAAGGEAAVTGK